MARMGAHRARGSARRGVLALLLFLLVLSTAGFGVYRYATGASGPSRSVTVEVPEGATADEVGNILTEAEVVRSSLAFRIAAGLRGLGEDLQAGVYDLRTNMSIDDALTALERGPLDETVTVTIPEGLEVSEVAAELGEGLGLDSASFVETATSGRFDLPPYLPEGTASTEGFLFPKTYEFDPLVAEEQVIERLLAQFEEEAPALDWGRADRLGRTPYEVVIIASMVEREARVEADRSKISAVIHNRLQEGMPLQIDATVQYALPEGNRELTFEDYKFESPYNTYLHPGLPPTPISNPGLASLQAALEPAKGDYLYFVVIDDSTGKHAFAETYQEFLRLKDRAGLS